MLSRCTACLLPETYPNIRFDDHGVCNYCRSFVKTEPKGVEAFKVLFNNSDKDRTKYDIVLGVSGGRDSSYTAHYISRVLGLRVLTCTVDNGLFFDETKESITNVVDALKVDHVTIKNGYTTDVFGHILHSWLKKPSLGMVGLFCTGCAYGMHSSLKRAAQQHGIKHVVHAGGEPADSFQEMLLTEGNKAPYLWYGFAKELIRNPRYFANAKCIWSIAREYLARFLLKYEYLDFFHYAPWNEEEILSLIQGKLNWKKPSYINATWRADCKMHQLRQYIYLETLGFTKNDVLLSGMIREKLITRESALKRLVSDNSLPLPFIESFLGEYGVKMQELDDALAQIRLGRPKLRLQRLHVWRT
jgi:hypothetical protein